MKMKTHPHPMTLLLLTCSLACGDQPDERALAMTTPAAVEVPSPVTVLHECSDRRISQASAPYHPGVAREVAPVPHVASVRVCYLDGMLERLVITLASEIDYALNQGAALHTQQLQANLPFVELEDGTDAKSIFIRIDQPHLLSHLGGDMAQRDEHKRGFQFELLYHLTLEQAHALGLESNRTRVQTTLQIHALVN